MQAPGAAISTSGPKLEKFASVSSTSSRHVAAPDPPASPSKSASADTVTTAGWFAGLNVEASLLLLPAATTNVTPAATAREIASSSAVLLHSQPRLMLATSMVPALAATQSMPAMIHEV